MTSPHLRRSLFFSVAEIDQDKAVPPFPPPMACFSSTIWCRKKVTRFVFPPPFPPLKVKNCVRTPSFFLFHSRPFQLVGAKWSPNLPFLLPLPPLDKAEFHNQCVVLSSPKPRSFLITRMERACPSPFLPLYAGSPTFFSFPPLFQRLTGSRNELSGGKENSLPLFFLLSKKVLETNFSLFPSGDWWKESTLPLSPPPTERYRLLFQAGSPPSGQRIQRDRTQAPPLPPVLGSTRSPANTVFP